LNANERSKETKDMATPSAPAGAVTAGAATNGEHHPQPPLQPPPQQQQAVLTDTLQAAFRGGELAGRLAFACFLSFRRRFDLFSLV
jgi:hypothetical protein